MSWVTFSPHFVLVSSYHPVESLFINFVDSFYPQKVKDLLRVVYITYMQDYFVIKFLVSNQLLISHWKLPPSQNLIIRFARNRSV